MVATENLKKQGKQAQIFDRYYGQDSDLQLDEKDCKTLHRMCQLSASTLGQRLLDFAQGTFRKNSFLRNAGLLLVLLIWPETRNPS